MTKELGTDWELKHDVEGIGVQSSLVKSNISDLKSHKEGYQTSECLRMEVHVQYLHLGGRLLTDAQSIKTVKVRQNQVDLK